LCNVPFQVDKSNLIKRHIQNIQGVRKLVYEGTQYPKPIHNKRKEAPHCLSSIQ